MSADDAIRRSAHAQRILDDEIVKEALDSIEQGLVEQMLAAPESDSEGRERLYRMIRTGRRFREFLKAVIEDGKVEQHKLQMVQRGQF